MNPIPDFGLTPERLAAIERAADRGVEPRIIPTFYNKYLAVSPDGFAHAIGVIEDTPQEAERAWWDAYRKRCEILAREPRV